MTDTRVSFVMDLVETEMGRADRDLQSSFSSMPSHLSER